MKQAGVAIISAQALKVVFQLLSVVVLSRLLAPKEFGVYAMVFVVIAFAEFIRDFGLSTTGITSYDLDDQDSSNLFWVGLALGLATALAVSLLAPTLASFYSEPEVALIAPISAIGLVLNGAQSQFQVILARSGKYISMGVTEAAAPGIGLVVAIISAMAGFGVFSLVAQSVSTALALLCMRLAIVGWIPKRPRHTARFREQIKSSYHFGVSQTLGYVSTSIDNFLVGLHWGAFSLGLYSRAYQLQSMPILFVFNPLTNLMVPKLVKLRDSSASRSKFVLRLQFMIGSSAVLFYACAASVAFQVIPLMLGNRWISMSNLFVVLCAAGALQSLCYPLYWMLLASGKSKTSLRNSVITSSISITAIVVASFFGTYQVAVTMAASQMMKWLITLYFVAENEGLRVGALLSQGMLIMFAGLSSYLASSHVGNIISFGETGVGLLFKLFVAILVFAAVVAFLKPLRLHVVWLLASSSKRGALGG